MIELLQWASSLPHVHFVTERTVIEWMRDPVPAEQLTAERVCPVPAGEVPCEPETQCDTGVTRFRVCGPTCPSSEVSPANFEALVCPMRPAMCTGAECLCGSEPAPCTVAQWSAWSECSEACDGGTRSRVRVVVDEGAPGSACPPLAQSEACNPQPCGFHECTGCGFGTSGVCSDHNRVCYQLQAGACPSGTNPCRELRSCVLPAAGRGPPDARTLALCSAGQPTPCAWCLTGDLGQPTQAARVANASL